MWNNNIQSDFLALKLHAAKNGLGYVLVAENSLMLLLLFFCCHSVKYSVEIVKGYVQFLNIVVDR